MSIPVKLLSWFLAPPITEFDPRSVLRILVVRQHDQLGDMICVVPLLRLLKRQFTGAQITLVASPVNFRIMLENPFVDRVLCYDKRRIVRSPAAFLGFLEELRLGGGYDLAIVPATVSLSFTSDVIAALAGSRYRIGPGTLSGRENVNGSLFNRQVTLDWSDQPHRHQTLRNIDILKPLRLLTADPGPAELQSLLGLSQTEREEGQCRVAAIRNSHKRVIAFHPGAGKEANRWPVDRFARIAKWAAATFDAAILVTSGPMDDEVLAAFRAAADFNFTVIEGTPIRQVAAILDHSDLVVSNDTGVMHVAGGLRPPLLSLFGPTDPLQWAPQGANKHVIAAPDGNITTITESEVQNKIAEILL